MQITVIVATPYGTKDLIVNTLVTDVIYMLLNKKPVGEILQIETS